MAKKDTPTEGLPPPGHERQEELKRRKDRLVAEGEQLMAELEKEAVDPAKLDPSKIDREVRQALNAHDEVWVSNADPNYRYAWIYRDPHGRFGGRFVHTMKAVGGGGYWEVVSGNMKEAREHIAPTGERWVADCLLMRCRVDKLAKLKLEDRERRYARQGNVASAFFDEAARQGVRAFDQDSMPAHIQARMESQSVGRQPSRPRGNPAGRLPGPMIPSARVMQHNAAYKLAQDKLVQQIRAGTIEGLTPEQAARGGK